MQWYLPYGRDVTVSMAVSKAAREGSSPSARAFPGRVPGQVTFDNSTVDGMTAGAFPRRRRPPVLCDAGGRPARFDGHVAGPRPAPLRAGTPVPRVTAGHRRYGYEADGRPPALGAGETGFDSLVPDDAPLAQPAARAPETGEVLVRFREWARSITWRVRPAARPRRSQRRNRGSTPLPATQAVGVSTVTRLASTQE